MNEETKKRTVLQILATIVAILALISLLPWLIAALISGMLFDAPSSGGGFFTKFIFFVIWVHPIAVAVGSFIIFDNKSRKSAPYVIGIGLTSAPIMLAIASSAAIEAFCKGQLSC